MWSSSIGRECNSSQLYCQAKGWFQKSQEFSNNLENGFSSGKMEGEKMDSHGKVLKMFSPLKILNSPFSKYREFWSFSSFLFFSMLLSLSFFLCSVSLPRMNSRIFEMFEEKQKKFKLSFKWDGSGYTKIYEIRGVAENLSTVDANPRMDLCTPIIFLVSLAAKFCEGKIILKNSKAQEEHIP
jgi:hypothetical protein